VGGEDQGKAGQTKEGWGEREAGRGLCEKDQGGCGERPKEGQGEASREGWEGGRQGDQGRTRQGN
jgi:hypothetical protein